MLRNHCGSGMTAVNSTSPCCSKTARSRAASRFAAANSSIALGEPGGAMLILEDSGCEIGERFLDLLPRFGAGRGYHPAAPSKVIERVIGDLPLLALVLFVDQEKVWQRTHFAPDALMNIQRHIHRRGARSVC